MDEREYDVVYRVDTGEAITVPSFLGYFGQPVPQYPHDWFEKNKLKPTLSIPIHENVDLDKLRGTVYKGIIDGSLQIGCAKVYLFETLKNLSNELSEEWKSFDVVIASGGQKISPWDLVTIKREGSFEDGNTGIVAPKKFDHAMCMYLIAIYRVTRIQSEKYRDSIVRSVKSELRSVGGGDFPVDRMYPKYCIWTTDYDYRKMIAAVDMYFSKFPTDPWANLRIGSQESRYRDCAGLLSYFHISKVLGFSEPADLKQWVFTYTLKEDFDRILKYPAELDKADSYFPYHVDFGMTNRTAYSSNMNQFLYFWCHAIGVLLGDKRSLNAKFFSNYVGFQEVYNAKLVGYVMAKKEEADKPSDTMEPKSKDALDWISFMEKRKNKFTPLMEDFFTKIKHGIQNPRTGTIAEHFKQIL